MNDTPTSDHSQAFAQRAEERHQRGAEDYLRHILKSAHYIDNVSVLLAAAAKEMKNSRFGNLGYGDISMSASQGLGTLLHRASTLFKNEKQLNQFDMSAVEYLPQLAHDTKAALATIAEQEPSEYNGLSEKTVIAAKAALRFFDNRLGRIASEPGLVEALKEYNDSYIARMAEAQSSHKTGRIDGHKERLAAEIKTHVERSAKSETRRTGVASFREAAIEQQKIKEQAPETVR